MFPFIESVFQNQLLSGRPRLRSLTSFSPRWPGGLWHTSLNPSLLPSFLLSFLQTMTNTPKYVLENTRVSAAEFLTHAMRLGHSLKFHRSRNLLRSRVLSSTARRLLSARCRPLREKRDRSCHV